MTDLHKRFGFGRPIDPSELPAAPPEPSHAAIKTLDAVANDHGFPSREPSSAPARAHTHSTQLTPPITDTMIQRPMPRRRAGPLTSPDDPPHTIAVRGPTSRLNRFIDFAAMKERELGRRVPYWDAIEMLLNEAGYDEQGRKNG